MSEERDRLIQFLYLLARDACPFGKIEAQIGRLSPGKVVYSSPGQEQWARDAAAAILGEPQP